MFILLIVNVALVFTTVGNSIMLITSVINCVYEGKEERR